MKKLPPFTTVSHFNAELKIEVQLLTKKVNMKLLIALQSLIRFFIFQNQFHQSPPYKNSYHLNYQAYSPFP